MNVQLSAAIATFCEKANQNEHAKKLVCGWDRLIEVAIDGAEDAHNLVIEGGIAKAYSPPCANDSFDHLPQIRIEGSAGVLASIFSGQSDPAAETVNGTISVFGCEGDQIKLDALSLVLWSAT